MVLTILNVSDVEVVTPGPTGKTFITQLYFRDHIPPSYENYVRTRGSQFGQVTTLKKGSNSKLPNGGSKVTFNIRLKQ